MNISIDDINKRLYKAAEEFLPRGYGFTGLKSSQSNVKLIGQIFDSSGNIVSTVELTEDQVCSAYNEPSGVYKLSNRAIEMIKDAADRLKK